MIYVYIYIYVCIGGGLRRLIDPPLVTTFFRQVNGFNKTTKATLFSVIQNTI